MTLASAFIIVQVLSATLYAGLASYVACSRRPRASDLPFIGFCLTQAFAACSFLLLTSPTPAGVIPELLRWRFGVAMLAPALFIHVAVLPLRGRPRQAGIVLVAAAYLVGATAAVLSGSPNLLLSGAVSHTLAQVTIVQSTPTRLGLGMGLFWAVTNVGMLLPVLLYLIRRGASARLRSDARRMLAPALLLTLALLTGTLAVGLPAESSPSLVFGLRLVQRLFSLGAGVLLANDVLRLGSPAGAPIHYSLSPIVIVLTITLLFAVRPLTHPDLTTDLAYLIAPLLTGLLAGALLSHPGLLRLSDRWLGRTPPSESAFATRLRGVWQRLPMPPSGPLPFEELAAALQTEIDAAYVEILELSGSPDSGGDRLIFTRGTDGPEIQIRGTDLEWPITERNSRPGQVVSRGLCGPASLILPILSNGEVAGALAVGEPLRGGVYAQGEVMRAELLVDLLSAARSAHIPIVGISSMPHASLPRPARQPKTLAIHAFGRLEVISPQTVARTPTIPLRARQLLAYLLTAYPHAVPGETLMERVWPDASPATASNNLYVAIYSLRRALEPGLSRGGASHYILHEDDAYRLNLDHKIWVDVRTFEDVYRRGTQMLPAYAPGTVTRVFQEALGLYRGPYLTEVALDLSPEVEAVRYRLQHHAEEMTRFVVGHLCSQGQWKEAKGLLLAMREADPWDDAFIDMLAQVGEGPGLALPQGNLQADASLVSPPRQVDS